MSSKDQNPDRADPTGGSFGKLWTTLDGSGKARGLVGAVGAVVAVGGVYLAFADGGVPHVGWPLCALGVVLTGVFAFFDVRAANRCKAGPFERSDSSLVWFEFETMLTPSTSSCRVAIIPGQPLLIMPEEEAGREGAVLILRYEETPDVCEWVVKEVDALVGESGVLDLPQSDPDRCFGDAALESPSVHIRIAYTNGAEWAGVFDRDHLPGQVGVLVRGIKELANEALLGPNKNEIDGDTAAAMFEPGPLFFESAVKVELGRTGAISADGVDVTFSELEALLDDLAGKNGAVLYSRECPGEEPTELQARNIQRTMDAVISRRLPIRMTADDQ